jgi:hypothetical protein
MTGHQDRPDIRQRRHVTQLRKALGLAPVPSHVGTGLRAVAPRVSEQVVGVVRQDPAYLALSPDGQMLLLSTVARAIDEFARLVEDRPPRAPSVETMLLELVHVEGRVEPCRVAVHAASRTLREAAHALWPQLPHARPHAAHLDEALARYAKGLCARVLNAPRTPTAPSTDTRSASGQRSGSLLDLVERRWGRHPVPLYLSVGTLGADGRGPRNTHRALSFVADDHVVTVAQDPIAPSRSAGATDPSVVVCVGPMPMSDIAQMYDTALLLLRLIRAGVAAPPSPVLIHVPNLGFLRPSPSEASVQQITDLLLPLSGHSSHRRSTLARTLQLCLRTATTAQGLAKQLAMHPQTVHNHLTTLRTLYNPDLDFAGDNLAMQAALDLVLPLWELESSGRPGGSPPHAKVP